MRVARHQAALTLRRDQENQVRNNPTPSETGEEGGGEEESTHPPPSGLPDTTLPPSTAQEWSSDTLGEGVGVRLTRTPTIPQFDGAEDSFTFSTTNTNTNTSSTASQTLWTIPRNYWSMKWLRNQPPTRQMKKPKLPNNVIALVKKKKRCCTLF